MTLFHPKPNECLRFDLESCNLMCTYTVVTHPCHIPPLTQARPMMLCIYTSNSFILLEHCSCNVYVLQIVRILSGAMITLSAVDPLNQRIMFVTNYLASWTDSTYGEQALSSLARTTTSTLGRPWCLASSHRYELREGGDVGRFLLYVHV